MSRRPARPGDPPTRRQARVRAFVAAYLRRRGHAPTYAQIADGLGLGSRQAAAHLVAALVARGLLGHEPRLARTLRLVEPLRNVARGR